MLVPESMIEEAMKAVQEKIKEEILNNLSISCSLDSTYDGSAGVRLYVELVYDGEVIAEDNDHVYFS